MNLKKLLYRVVLLLACVSLLFGCKETTRAQDLVDRAIAVSGGEKYKTSEIEFTFRGRVYRLSRENGQRIYWRHSPTDSGDISDKMIGNRVERYFDGAPVALPDSMARKYANSINSVHYFAYLPYGLNDQAVRKKYLGERKIKGKPFHCVAIRFDQQGGGVDYEDVFIYWFNPETGLPDYLAYEYHTEGGGMRFRVATHERFINGIRFVDYKNYKPRDSGVSLTNLVSLYEKGELELLSEIKLESIRVIPGNYN